MGGDGDRGENKGSRRAGEGVAQAPDQVAAVVPPPFAALRALNPLAAEQASSLYAKLSPPHSLKSVQEATAILAESPDVAEIVATPEIRVRCIEALANILPVAACSEEGVDILDAYRQITRQRVDELPAEYDDLRRAAYLEAVKTGDLELLLRVESMVLGRLEVAVNDLQDAAIRCCVNALRAENSRFEGNPVQGFLRVFGLTQGFDLDAITSSAEIRLEHERQIRRAIEEGHPNKLRKLAGLDSSGAPDGPEIDPNFEASRVMGFQTALRRGDVFTVSQIAKRWSMPSDTTERIETRRAALHGIGRTVDRGESGSFASIVRVIPGVMAESDQDFAAEAAPVLARATVAYLNTGNSKTGFNALLELGIPLSVFRHPDVCATIEDKVVRPILLTGDLSLALTAAERIGIDATALSSKLSPDDKVASFIAGIRKLNLAPLAELRQFLDTSGKIVSHPAVIEVAKQRLASEFQENPSSVSKLAELFPAIRPELNNLAVRACGSALLEQRLTAARDIAEGFLAGQDIPPQHPALPPLLRDLSARQEIGGFDGLFDFVRSNSAYVSHLRRTNTAPHLTKDEFNRLGRLGIAQHYVESFRGSNELGDLAKDDGAEKIITYLKRNDMRWSSPVFQERFNQGVRHFGSAAMLRFVSHPEHSPEHCVMGMEAIVALATESGLSPGRFAEQILLQVRRDGGEYEAGSPYEYLHTIARALRGKFTAALVEVEAAAALEGSLMAPLRGQFSSAEQGLASWDRFKRLASFIEVARNPELLRALASMRGRGLAREADYLSAISMRPDSKVDLSLALRFIESPDKFFRTESDWLGSRKLLGIPHLGLDGEVLRDAIIHGKLDAIAALPPCRAECKVVVRGDKVYQSVRQLLSDALGSQRANIRGFATNTKELFLQAQRVLKDAGASVPEYLLGKSVSPQVEQTVRALAIDPTFGMKVETITFKVAVHPKSAPEAATAGDETQCCMPFGDYKQNDYMTQPNVAHFTVQIVRGDGIRTVAQSVLTKDVDIRELSSKFPFDETCEFVAQIAPGLPAARVIAADNVEVNRNARDPKNVSALIGVYRAFFKAYNARLSEQTGVESSFVVVGKQYSDALNELPNIPNTFVPQNFLKYTDKTESTVGQLKLDIDTSAIAIELLPVQSAPPEENHRLSARLARHITYQDLPEVVHVVAQSNPGSLVDRQRVDNLQALLQGKDIVNAVRGRPNLSVGIRTEARLSGYLIAFEGEVEGTDDPAVVIADAGTIPKGAYAAGALLRTFTDLYRRNYVDKENLPPVIIQGVSQENSALFVRAAEKVAQALGVSHTAEQITLAGEKVIKVTFSLSCNE